MPNWCDNHLQITGPEDALTAFLQLAAGSEPLEFDRLCPQPNLSAFDEAWYGWRIAHWGTKWEPGDVELSQREPRCAALKFSTAWSPPEALIDCCSAQWPQLRFTLSYAEAGNDFAGRLVIEGGHVVEERSGDYAAICELIVDNTGEEYWVQRGPLEEVCRELAPDPQSMVLNATADRLTAEQGATALTETETDELVILAARRGHYRLTSALVDRLTISQVVSLAQTAANSLSSTGGALRALRESDDAAVAAIGKIFSLLGPALTPDVPRHAPWDGTQQPVPAFREILEHAVAERMCHEWVETVAGLLHEWTADDVETLLRTAWALR